MANICWFEMRIRGMKNNCYAMLGSDIPCYDAYVKAEKGTDDDYMIYFGGECRWSVTESMVDPEIVEETETLAAKAKKYNIELEVCGLSEDGVCERYHYNVDKAIAEWYLLPYLMENEVEDGDIRREDLEKYEKGQSNGKDIYVLKKEFLEQFKFDEEREEAMFRFHMSFNDMNGVSAEESNEELAEGRSKFFSLLKNELEKDTSCVDTEDELQYGESAKQSDPEESIFRKLRKLRENLMLTDLNSNPFEAFIGEMEVQGTAYEGRSDRIEYLKVGDAVQLVREPANAYNTLNISVRNKNGESLGNLEKEFCDAFAPLIDEGILKFREASVLSVEPLSKRGPRAKKAYLHISFAFDFDEKLKENTCLVYLVGGDQTNIWAQKIRAYVCLIPIAHMKMIFEIYNRFSNEYDLDNNNVFYVGLDNLAAEVIKAREKMRSEMKSGLSYEKVDEESECFYEYLMKRIKEEKERYQDLAQYTDIFEDCENDHDPFFMDALFSCLSLGLVDTYWIDQTQVTETEFDDEFYGFNHWYEIAEVFDANECIFDFSDEDVVGIFGSDKFKAFIDLSYGC